HGLAAGGRHPRSTRNHPQTRYAGHESDPKPTQSELLHRALPVLPHEILPEAVMRLLGNELEPGSLVDPPRLHEHIVGPQHHVPIPCPPREPHTLVHEPGTDTVAPSTRLDQEQPELRGVVIRPYTKHAANRSTVDLGDPGVLPRRVARLGVVR